MVNYWLVSLKADQSRLITRRFSVLSDRSQLITFKCAQFAQQPRKIRKIETPDAIIATRAIFKIILQLSKAGGMDVLEFPSSTDTTT